MRFFAESKAFIESLDISQLHVFTYSERSGTAMLKINHVVNPKVKQERSKALLDISDKKLRNFYESQKGTSRKVLFEQAQQGEKMFGFTENYVKIVADYAPTLINNVSEVIVGENNVLIC